MLPDWLGDMDLAAFREAHLQKQPLAKPGTTHGARELFHWHNVGQVLAAKPDILVVAGGQLLPFPAPTDALELKAYFRMGIGVAMRHTQKVDAGLRTVADAFERDVGESQVQLFVTPRETHGFGWHYDDEDVFIAQTSGVKDYYFRPNTVAEGKAAPTKFQAYPQETSPIHTATLVAGDFLYIPARWWHMAICREDALSISVGVYPRAS